MKVAFVLTQLEVGGAQSRVLQTASELRRRGHIVDVFFLYRKRDAFEAEPKIILHATGRPRAWQVPILLWKLRKLVRKGGYDAVVCNTAPANVLGSFIAALAGTPRRIAVQTQPPSRVSLPVRALDLICGMLGIYTRNIANSHWTRGCFDAYPALYKKRMRIVFDGIDPPRGNCPRAEARAQLGLASGDFVVANVGRLSAQKDQATLIRAMRGVDGVLLIAGDGELKPELSQLVVELGIEDRVRFLGELSRTDLANALGAADVFAFSSRWETFGLALIEAAAMGLPLVVTDLDVSREVLNASEGGDTAIFLPTGDHEGFRSALTSLRAEKPLRERLKRGSKRAAGRFTIERHVDALMPLLQEG